MKTLILLLFVFVSLLSSAQDDPQRDSLRIELTKQQPDTIRVFTLLRYGLTYFYSEPDSSRVYAEKAFALAEKIKFLKGQAQSLAIIGNVYFETGNYLKALETQLQVLQLHEKRNDPKGIAACYCNMSRVYQEQEDFANSIAYQLKAISIFENFKSKDQQEKNKVENDLLITLLNTGDNYEKMDRLDSALLFQTKAYELALRIEDKENVGMILNNLGNIHTKLNHPDIAFGYYKASLPYIVEINDVKTLAEARYGLASIFHKRGRADSALYFARLSLNDAYESLHPKMVQFSTMLLSQIYEEKNRPDSALKYFKVAMNTRDTMFNADIVRKVQTMNMKEEQRQKLLELEKKKQAEERRNNSQMLGIAVFIILFLLGLLYIGRRHVKPRALKYLGLLAVLMLFEFINFTLHPIIGHITHHVPILFMLVTLVIASILVPMHHKVEHWMQHKLEGGHKKNHALTPPVVEQEVKPEPELQTRVLEGLPAIIPEDIPVEKPVVATDTEAKTK